jgi:hypothetical protein
VLSVRRSVRVTVGALAAVLLCLYPATTASAAQAVALGAAFAPYRLGAPTTIELNLQIQAPAGQIPSALTEVEVRYPENLGFDFSGLGLAVCSPATVAAAGTGGCPADSIMGRGDALAQLRFGPQLVSESASISIARAADEEGHIALLLYASGPSPVNTQILSPAQLLPAGPPFGGRLHMQLPLIPSVPGAPDVAIVSLRVSIGPQGLTYYEQTEGSTLAYIPKGIPLPTTCPRGGFPFAATFSFLDGSHPVAKAIVPCPDPRGRRHRTARHYKDAVMTDASGKNPYRARRGLLAADDETELTSAKSSASRR